jgi:exodeoxyribonuclease V alpha subunit
VSSSAVPALLDQLPWADARRAVGGPLAPRAWNDAAVLISADVHVAARLAELLGETDDTAVLGAAFAVRAVRTGHVCVDLETISASATSDLDPGADLSALPWPDPVAWLAAMASSRLVAGAEEAGPEPPKPLRLDGSRLYLERYWRQECQVASDLADRAARPAIEIDQIVLRGGLARLFPPGGGTLGGALPEAGAGPGAEGGGPGAEGGGPEGAGSGAEGAGSRAVGASPEAAGPEAGGADVAPLAAAVALIRPLSVVAGGPGTGKTTTVARILALLFEQASAAGARPPRVALAAPTGKAAARLAQAVHDEALAMRVDEQVRSRLLTLDAGTLHRLLGWRPDSSSRFAHDRSNRLPHDFVVVDETSMLSLSLMARLLDAVRPDARLVLVGDPQQLASVEAGAVLGDVVGPAAGGWRMSGAAAARLGELTGMEMAGGRGVPGAVGGLDGGGGSDGGGSDVPRVGEPGGASGGRPDGRGLGAIGDGIVVLRRVHRFGGSIARLAAAISDGDGAGAVRLLSEEGGELRWPDADAVRADVVTAGQALVDAARGGRDRGALDALGMFRVLCAHRKGPAGVAAWNDRIERWLASAIPGYASGGPWYAGRPLLVTANDYEVQLFNGDTGVTVARGDRTTAVFERRGRVVEVSPALLRSIETLHAMTIHKSQGSQFDEVVVVLPEVDGPIVTRELLYTAVTRARRRVTLIGSEAVLRSAIARPVARASGLRQRLWGDD